MMFSYVKKKKMNKNVWNVPLATEEQEEKEKG